MAYDSSLLSSILLIFLAALLEALLEILPNKLSSASVSIIGDLVYFDPPYHPLNKTSSFTSYSGSFGREEQTRMRDYYKELNDKGVYVILSNSSSSFIKEIYNEFNVIEVYCNRSINSKSNKREKIPESLVVGDQMI